MRGLAWMIFPGAGVIFSSKPIIWPFPPGRGLAELGWFQCIYEKT